MGRLKNITDKMDKNKLIKVKAALGSFLFFGLSGLTYPLSIWILGYFSIQWAIYLKDLWTAFVLFMGTLIILYLGTTNTLPPEDRVPVKAVLQGVHKEVEDLYDEEAADQAALNAYIEQQEVEEDELDTTEE